ncbi:hypothetical protein J8L85_01385 [Maribacter sp. MMG018]|uniref:hypothetical protein n=1 Tax=Maribacter sp. MMG018 TaxID=2822688 RepID=UPI001B39C429|nr:hypothetical protein [Maribacter sp. MMG018]MBQ4913070.1 hypothetical protein [Maribacter sp. MMG018]
MAKEKLVTIKEAELKNNCPECFNQDLKLTFYQKHTYGAFFHKTTNDITNQIVCRKCNSMIYPVKWTDDIERMFDYYQKTVVPEKKSTRPTFLFYILLLIVIALIATGVYFYLGGTIKV